jgi:succinate dehydrogenase / fumarate reductase iron-sulfur subunit
MGDNDIKTVIFTVQRFNPEKDKNSYFQSFQVPVKRGTTVLEGLLYIRENIDSSLAFRTSCRMGICGSCAMYINGYPHLACHTQVEEFHSGKLVIKPLPNHKIIKDLVPSLSEFFEKHKEVHPYIIRHDSVEIEERQGEFLQKPEELSAFLQFSYCIKCGICVAACPTAASDIKFLGPQALSQVYRYCADNRDEGLEERLSIVEKDHGIWNCHFASACSEACPKGVDPAFAIQLLRRRLLMYSMHLGIQTQRTKFADKPDTVKGKIEVPQYTAK